MKCPECLDENIEIANFCNLCGFDFRGVKNELQRYRQPARILHTKAACRKNINQPQLVEGERKLVTVLFADVANYTAMSDIKLSKDGANGRNDSKNFHNRIFSGKHCAP
jgi:hypothetical protein